MTVLSFALIAAPIARNIDPQEVLRYFNWLAFAIFALVYSALVFTGELSKDGPLIFSKRNARPFLQILILHCAFIVILLLFVRISNQVVPILPYWMTDTFNVRRGARASLADLVFLAVAAITAYIERKWLYREPAQWRFRLL
jgi:hypothetical protein